jgi:phosphopantothenate synthetase
MKERQYFAELLEKQQKQVIAIDLNFDVRAASTSQSMQH